LATTVSIQINVNLTSLAILHPFFDYCWLFSSPTALGALKEVLKTEKDEKKKEKLKEIIDRIEKE
jgi:hypothetical protein